MIEIPLEVQDYLISKIVEKRIPAFFELDKDGKIIDFMGNVNNYCNSEVHKDMKISELFPLLENYFPLKYDHLDIPMVSDHVEIITDFHLFQANNRFFLVLLDSSFYERKLRDVLQKRNNDLLRYEKYLNSLDDLVIFDIVAFQNALVLERLPNKSYVVRGKLPGWVNFIPIENITKEITEYFITERFPFLESFLATADIFWERRTQGKLKSDLWAEDDNFHLEIYFEASAMIVKNKSILLIEHSHSSVKEKFSLIQRARELKLEREKRIKAEETLSIKNKQLNELNATKDKFFSIIAHDLKNPLAGLRNLIDLVLHYHERMSQEKFMEIFHLLDMSSNQLYKLLDNLLQWSRAQTGSIAFHPFENDLSLLVGNNINMFKPNANKKNIELKTNALSETIAYYDEDLIDTVLRNLIANAIKFTPQDGKVNIDVSVSEDYIEVSVSDTGVGISKADINRLFRIDTHFSTCGTDNEPGTGLGLILCKEFVTMNGGKLNVESKEEKGSKFSFTIPKYNKNS